MKKELYIIHGWTYTIAPWTAVVSILRSQGYTIHQLKVPGLTAPSKEVWDIDGYVDWLHTELKGAKKPIVLGHSNGGRIALNYLKQYPDSFGQLILLNSAGINIDNESISLKRRLFKIVSIILRPLRYIPLVRRVVYRLIGASDYERAPDNMKKTLQNMLSSDRILDITDIVTKTTILWGKQDTVTPLAQGQKMATLLPTATLEEFEAWAHAPYITHPNELARAITEALENK